MLSSSKKIHASVFSVAGLHSSGSCCTKPLIAGGGVDRFVELAVDVNRFRHTVAAPGRS